MSGFDVLLGGALMFTEGRGTRRRRGFGVRRELPVLRLSLMPSVSI